MTRRVLPLIVALSVAAFPVRAGEADISAGETVPLPPVEVKSKPKTLPEKPAVPATVVTPAVPTPPRTKSDGDAAEFVPLPAEKPDLPVVSKNATVARAKVDERTTITLTIENSLLQPGEAAQFSLYGPETFLRSCVGHYSVTDQLERVTAQGIVRIQELPFKEGEPRRIQVPLPPPLTQQHTFQLQLTAPDARTFQLNAPFNVARSVKWDGWLALTSAPPPSGDWSVLNAAGIRGGLQYRLHPARREALRKGFAPFFVENVSRQLLSRYHTEAGLWEKAIAAMQADKSARSPLMREPSLCTPLFAEQLASEIKRHAEIYVKDPPLFYSLASEPSLTRLSAAADFDFSPAAIVEFQRWLERDVYGTLNALNGTWGTDFRAWSEVQPMTTDEARLRLRDGVYNFAPWTDFRAFQDFTFSKTLADSANLLRSLHPGAKAGITGAMGPAAFGGWDWTQLAGALDVVEAYDIGGARALWRDLAPGKPALATFAIAENSDPAQTASELAQTLWPLLLEGGARGVLLWDASGGKALTSGRDATPLCKALRPLLQTFEQKAGPLLAQCSRKDDGVAMLYSPASVRLYWLLEANILHGDNWLKAWGADSSAERRESPQLRLRESWGKLLDDMGVSWRFVASPQLENREFLKAANRPHTLVLPRTIALSEREIECIKQFVQEGGRIVIDACCGQFDEHGRRRARAPLDELLGIDTTGEPFFAGKINPLEVLAPVALPPGSDAALLRDLAPPFSDVPKFTGKHAVRVEYRRSPVLAASKAGAYLNLDLTDYLRWRLHPDQPRARATRELIAAAAFSAARENGQIDWDKTRLPYGTQIVRLVIGRAANGDASGAEVLALRRNPQQRLHELGTEAEGNWAFEKAEDFELVLRQPRSVQQFFPERAGAERAASKLAGRLLPDEPVIFILSGAAAVPLEVSAPARAQTKEPFELTAKAGTGPQAFTLSVFGPDDKERPHYGGTVLAPDGTLIHHIPFAFNDLPGVWKISVLHLNSGARRDTHVTLKAGE